MSEFNLHATLEKELLFVKDLELCRLFLLPDSDIPWCVLVPRVDEVREIFELSDNQQVQLMNEISLISKGMKEEFDADKMNIGALGNMVPQLHIHIICRFKDDRAWPGSIWGTQDKSNQKMIESNLQRVRLIHKE